MSNVEVRAGLPEGFQNQQVAGDNPRQAPPNLDYQLSKAGKPFWAAEEYPDEGADATPFTVRWRIGDTFREKAAGRVHTYRLIAIKPHVTRTGHQSAVLYWSGRCAACGAQMVALSGKRPHELIRTCLEHRGKWRWAASAEGAANG